MFRNNKKENVLPLRSLRLCGENSAFSLIELLVAMAVTIVIVFMVTNMFRNASEAWDIGTQRSQMNTAARAAVDLIARELAGAVAGSMPNPSGGNATPRPFTLYNGNDVRFSALSKAGGSLRGVMFRLDSAKRIIEMAHNNDSSYGSSEWNWPNAELVITNVWRFEVNVYSNESALLQGQYANEYDSSATANSDQLPVCVDIAIEMLNDRDIRRAMSLNGPDDDHNSPRYGYVMTNSRVYTTRVWLGNRGGR